MSSSNAWAPSAEATAPAIVSALMLKDAPSSPGATGAITGTTPSSRSLWRSETRTASGSPTSPRSTEVSTVVESTWMCCSPSANQAVVLAREPDRASAREGDAGRDPLVDRAAEAISATSIVAASVTRSPATNTTRC